MKNLEELIESVETTESKKIEIPQKPEIKIEAKTVEPTKTVDKVKTVDTVKIKEEVKLTAHRGFSGIAPENTLVAFEKAGEYREQAIFTIK